MKIRTTIVAAVIAMALPSYAAIYLVTNVVTGTGATDALYQNFDGTLSNGGIVAMGYFPTNSYVPSSSLEDIELTIADFSITASALAGSLSPTLKGAFPGYVEAEGVAGAFVPIGGALSGRALYVFTGNAATLGASTEWALKQTATILPDEPLMGEYFANPLGGLPPIIGNLGTYAGNAGGQGVSVYQTLQMVPIPEPSAALLGAFCVLGLLRRRRI